MDNLLSEMDHRFGEQSQILIKSLLALCPSSTDWLSKEILSPFCKLVVDNEKLSDLHAELHVGKNFILSHLEKLDSVSTISIISDITKLLFPYKDAFPVLYSLYASALTFGASTAICESSFSTLTRVLSPFRRSMLSKRLVNLSFLAYEKDITSSLKKDDFLAHFSASKRKLCLWKKTDMDILIIIVGCTQDR